jgi:hypothetical protein
MLTLAEAAALRHNASPGDGDWGESTCTICGVRVIQRANAHGYFVWRHRKESKR